MKSDRMITFKELLQGKCTKEYLDKKEKHAIICRHIRRLSDQIFEIEDKISVCGETEFLRSKISKLQNKVRKLKEQLVELAV